MAVTVQVHYANLSTTRPVRFAFLRTVLRPIAKIPYFSWLRTPIPSAPSSATIQVHWADLGVAVPSGFLQVHYGVLTLPTTFVSTARIQVQYAALVVPSLSQGYFNVYKLVGGVWVSTTTYAARGGVWV
jgi:hypothetical protein